METVLTYVVCALTALFALLHLIAALSQLKSHSPAPHILMLGGALGALAAALDCLLRGSFDWLLMLLGGAMVCAAALWNGRQAAKSKGENHFHLSHHITRAGLVLILVISMVKL